MQPLSLFTMERLSMKEEDKSPHNRVGEIFIQLGCVAKSKGFILRHAFHHYELEDKKDKLIYKFETLDKVKEFLDSKESK
jgi:hypothetical protein